MELTPPITHSSYSIHHHLHLQIILHHLCSSISCPQCPNQVHWRSGCLLQWSSSCSIQSCSILRSIHWIPFLTHFTFLFIININSFHKQSPTLHIISFYYQHQWVNSEKRGKEWDKWNWWVCWTKREMMLWICKNQDSTMWEWLNRSDVDWCLWMMFLIHMVTLNIMWMCEIWALLTHHINQSYQLWTWLLKSVHNNTMIHND